MKKLQKYMEKFKPTQVTKSINNTVQILDTYYIMTILSSFNHHINRLNNI
jgi:hypothetical protein